MGRQPVNVPEETDKTSDPDPVIIRKKVGIWEFWTIKQPRFDLCRRWEGIVSGIQLFLRLVTEVSTISRTLLIFFALSKLWKGVETAVLMHLSSSLLQTVEAGIRDGEANTLAILLAIVSRLSCLAFVAALDWWTCDNSAFKTRILQHYERHIMQGMCRIFSNRRQPDSFSYKARLDMDLSTAQDPESQVNISPDDAWQAFCTIVYLLRKTLSALSHFTLIVHASRFSGGPAFVLSCVAQPLLRMLFTEDVWSKMWIANLKHTDFQRMQALSVLATDTYRQEIITGNLKSHILIGPLSTEYDKAKNKLGDTCTDEFSSWRQLQRSSLCLEVVCSIAGDLPMVYCAANVVINPSRFSIASVAVLQQSSYMLRDSLQTIFCETQTFNRHVTKLKNLYAMLDKVNKTQQGNVPYPSPQTSKDGMALELKNVIFTYPGSKSKLPALRNVSLDIKPGQLVVIVGANGSGKSTLIKLLTRLYDPSSGTLLVDDTPVQEYRPLDVRRTIASFTQDHNLYPLSLYENIAFGDVALSTDTAAVAAAAEQGGATEFIAKFVDGSDTILDPRNNIQPINLPDDPEHPLRNARTFMHLNSGHVNFVSVDEPSSALDPEAEYQIFNRLIASRSGKTMVFVTHRFGHLTKHADFIICMKDGAIAESGCHEELMKIDGEYAKLYQIQANAFSHTTT
ncbi:hypothetical protein C0993_005627 [Termitomyces sp. T159_Od127]|nr:hypothetical protein C0993_005627 [Termitomyces sp. T159_Od127]